MVYTKEERRKYDSEWKKRPGVRKRLTEQRITRMKNPVYREHRRKLQRERYVINLVKQRMRYKTLRIQLINLLGGRCNCKRHNCWHKGRCKVTFIECVHIDHKKGGNKERKKRGINQTIVYYLKHIKKAKKKLQPLCANCNWIKRNREEVKRKYD
jgi:hypothetical protein